MTRTTASAPALSLTPWSAGINIAGALAVGWGLWRGAAEIATWVLVLAFAGLVAWVLRMGLAVIGGRRADVGRSWRLAGVACLVVMAIAGGITAIPTQGLGVVPLMIAVLVLCGDPGVPHVLWGVIGLVGVLGIAAGALLSQAGLAGSAGEAVDVRGLLAVLAGLALAVVGGLGRRAQRVLLAERERASAEAVRAQAAAHRVAIARDLHDVLAHSLGGLVVQLDAAEALLETGDAERAAVRVAAARRLAVSGLDEAREAVRTLREPDREQSDPSPAPVDPAALDRRLRALFAAHGTPNVHFDAAGAARVVSAALAEALVRAVQEGLSNARKHAPGAAVRVALVWHPDRVECRIENPAPAAGRPEHDGAPAATSGLAATGELAATGNLAPSGGLASNGALASTGGVASSGGLASNGTPAATSGLASTGGGFGLRGVRERFAAVGGTVTAGTIRIGEAEGFRLRVEAPA